MNNILKKMERWKSLSNHNNSFGLQFPKKFHIPGASKRPMEWPGH